MISGDVALEDIERQIDGARDRAARVGSGHNAGQVKVERLRIGNAGQRHRDEHAGGVGRDRGDPAGNRTGSAGLRPKRSLHARYRRGELQLY